MTTVDTNSSVPPPCDFSSSLVDIVNACVESGPAGCGENSGLEGLEDWCASETDSAIGVRDGDQKAVAHAQEHELENTPYFSQIDTRPDLRHGQLVSGPAKPFQRWIRTLHKRAARRQGMLGCDGNHSVLRGEGGDALVYKTTHQRHSSDSSFGFVTTVKSATVSLAGASLLTRSRINPVRSSRGHSRTDHSSRASVSRTRLSEDSFRPERQSFVDPAVMERSLQRRRILEELIETEESYIGDVRFLMNVRLSLWTAVRTRNSNQLAGLRHNTRLNAHHAAMFTLLC